MMIKTNRIYCSFELESQLIIIIINLALLAFSSVSSVSNLVFKKRNMGDQYTYST